MNLYDRIRQGLEDKGKAGLLKPERVIASSQGAEISVMGREKPVLNFCANNYLGLANHPKIIAAARKALDTYGYGLSSVRFICGTQRIHKQLEQRLAEFLGMEDTLLYTSCFDANGGLFEGLLGESDAIVSARLNHASIIDGVRLAKARRFRYEQDQPEDFRRVLGEATGQGQEGRGERGDAEKDGVVLAMTDGVFSMEGSLAPLDKLAPIAREFGALLAVDDSHATGFVGKTGRGTPERFGVKVDVVTSTLGKALGGACGGFISGKKELIEWLRNVSRPYLFSNSLAPALVAGAIAALDIVTSDEGAQLRQTLRENTDYFRAAMRQVGYKVPEGEHPIVPVMLGDAALATRMAARLLDLGLYVIGFSYPVVPQGEARIRVQISAAHAREHIDRAVEAFAAVGREEKLIPEAPVRGGAAARPATMRAWVYSNKPLPDGGRLKLERVPIPTPQPGELLLKIRCVSVCGTDEDLFRGKFNEIEEGIIPGHELFGEIVGFGSNVRGFEIGQKIVAESHYLFPGFVEEGVVGLWGPKIREGQWLRPLNGGYAEYTVLPTYCAHIVPGVLDTPDFFPSLLEGVGNDCLIAKYLLDHGLLGTAGFIGCGPHGLFAQMFSKHFNVRRIAAFDIDPKRLAMAREFGADELLNPKAPDLDARIAAITEGKGFDVMVDMAGGKREVLDMCFKRVRDGGTVLLFGLYGDETIKLEGRTINDIIFSMSELTVNYEGKRVRVKGCTGREGVWAYLIDAVAASKDMQKKIMQLVTVMGPLDRLGADTLTFDPKKILKRAYRAFDPEA